MSPRTRLVLPLLLLAPLASCGGESPDAAPAAEALPPDTAVKPIERQPLTEEDMAGLDFAQLAVELPWTRNTIARDPAPNAPRATVTALTVEEHDGFDRAVFTFSTDAPFPGYTLRMVDAGEALTCGEEATSPAVSGDRWLVLSLRPARAHDDEGRRVAPLGAKERGQRRFAEAGLTCDRTDTVHWVAALSEGDVVRVFEMRSPPRLVVDVR